MNALTPCSFLVLSDIHFGSFSGHPDFAVSSAPADHFMTYAKPMKASLINAVKNLDCTINAILVPGDLTSRATPSEFRGCLRVVQEIAAAINVSADSIFYTFGNHDTDWLISQLSDHEGASGDDGYADIASSAGSVFVKNPSTLNAGPVPGAGVVETADFRLVIANSSYFSTHNQAYKHGRLGNVQLRWLLSTLEDVCIPNKWNMLMLHHHPFPYPYPVHAEDISFLEEGAELMEAIGKSHIDFVCHGHRHHAKVFTTMEDGWLSPVTFLCAGTVAADATHRSEGNLPNLFHVVTLLDHAKTAAALGQIHTFEFNWEEGWTPLTYTRRTKLDGIQRFGAFSNLPDKKVAARAVLDDTLNNCQENFCVLPPYQDLVDELKCMTMTDLKDLMQDVAATLECKFISFYDTPSAEAWLKRGDI